MSLRKVKEIIFLGTGIYITLLVYFKYNVERILIGCVFFTGTSSGVPVVACLTNPEGGCETCMSTLTPEGEINIRRNTSLLVRVNHEDGRIR
jgi:hypothetical protein